MKIKKQNTTAIILWTLSIIFFIGIMILFAFTDKQISTTIFKQGVVDKSKTYHLVVSAIGATMLVLAIFFALQGLIQKLMVTKIKSKAILYWVLNVLLIIISLIINFWSMINHPNDRVWEEWIVQIVMGIIYLSAIISYDACFWNKQRKNEIYINNNFWLALRTVIFLAAIFIIVNIMKTMFGRPRPAQVLKDPDKYVYHYPFSISRYSNPRPLSFPSGHAISAMSIFGLTLMFYTKPSWKRYSINSLFAVLVILVSIARILGIHHWASDTFMSMGIGALAYNLCMKLFNKKLINE